MIRLIHAYSQRYSHQESILQWAGLAGAVGFPLFYWVYTQVIVQTYENLTLRCIAMLLCAGMAARRFWPESWLKYYGAYAYVCLIFCLPFFHVFMTLKNDGGLAFMADSLMALSFLVLLMDWRNTLVITVVGALLGWCWYSMTTDVPVWPAEYAARLPTVILILIGGNLFKLSERHLEAERIKARTIQVRLDTQTALAGSIAHEMRNPLSQVSYSLDRIGHVLADLGMQKGTAPLGGAQLSALRRYVAQGQTAIARGLQVIEMTLREVQSKPLDASGFVYLSAASVTRKAAEEYSFERESDRERVKIVIKQDFYFRGDETIYLFVIFNLLKNALYYFQRWEDAHITLTVDNGVVSVRDTGPGISSIQLQRLFEAFQTAGKHGGTGLGLAFCQRAMRACGGSIDCTSVEGEFTEFFLRFPPVSHDEVQGHVRSIFEQAAPILHGKCILIVDDEPHLRAMPRHTLDGLGAQVQEAHTGLAALEKVSANAFDLIIMDLHMPVLDGYVAAQRIRDLMTARGWSAPIIAYTSEPAYMARDKALQAGMTGFLTKPCTPAELVRALSSALSRGAPVATGPRLDARVILVADDDALNRQAIRHPLEMAGASVIEVADGQAVLETIETTFPPVDAAVLDLHMPALDGLATAREIRSRRWPFNDLPLIALTGFADDSQRQAADEAGIADVLVKPVQAASLLASLDRALNGLPRVAPSDVPDPCVSADLRVNVTSERGSTYLWLSPVQIEQFRRYNALSDISSIMDTLDTRFATLQHAVTANDRSAIQEALHSMLGLYGLIGCEQGRSRIRQFYVPFETAGALPDVSDWLEQLQQLLVGTRAEVDVLLREAQTS